MHYGSIRTWHRLHILVRSVKWDVYFRICMHDDKKIAGLLISNGNGWEIFIERIEVYREHTHAR